MKLRTVVSCTVLCLILASVGYADEKNVADTPLGVEQKLKRLYELYRAGETASLSQRETRFSLGLAYVVEDQNTLGLQASKNGLSLIGSLSYGLTDWLEAGISMPLQYTESHIESPNENLFNDATLGLGGVSIRLITAIPTKGFDTTALLSLTLPTGDKDFGADRTYSLLGVNVAKVLRPAFLFGGLGWQRDWNKDINGIVYSGGLGFFLNHTLSLGVELGGTRYLNPARGGIYNTAVATVRATYQSSPTFGLAPFMSMGLTDSAPDATVGLNLYWSVQ